MRIVAIGNRSFVSGFQLGGVSGLEVKSSQDAWEAINNLVVEDDVGLIIVSDDVARPIQDKLTQMRSKKPVPLIYGVPSPGAKQEKVEYRDMLKQILGV